MSKILKNTHSLPYLLFNSPYSHQSEAGLSLTPKFPFNASRPFEMKTTAPTLLFLSALVSTTLTTPITPLQSRYSHIQLIQRACKPLPSPQFYICLPSSQRLQSPLFQPPLTHPSIKLHILHHNSRRKHTHDPRRRYAVDHCCGSGRGCL